MSTTPDTPLSIYEGDRRDLDAVMKVMTDAFDPSYGEAWSRTQCSGIMIQPGVWLTLANYDGEPAGFTLARMIVDEAELLLIGVRPQFRRAGIGTALLDRNCQVAATLGAMRVHLEVREGNSATQFYRTRGFEPVGRRKNYYRGAQREQFDAITLACALKPPNK